MSWSTKLKDKAQDYLTELVIALVVLLLGAIWAAVPSEVWGKVSAAIPKRALWSVIALLASGLTLETAYVAHLRRKYKLKWRFGIRWSKSLEPFCPVCPTPLSNYGQHAIFSSATTMWGFICPQCKEFFPMTDDEGNRLELKEAKQLLASKSGKPQQTNGDEVTEIEEKILVQMARKRDGVTEADLTYFLKLHPDRVILVLSEMDQKGYIYSINVALGHNTPTKYHLSDKGRAILVKKDLI
jgi:hypothetical protein